jgi:putative Mg2+ transporter-C (MgtC) family protein
VTHIASSEQKRDEMFDQLLHIDFSQEPWSLILRILIAALLGAVLGAERDMRGRAAGLRTHLLVTAGAALFMVISIKMAEMAAPAGLAIARTSDPGRIAAQIVTGIGFLGAGAIIKDGFTVRGLTTAACLWISASIGMATGAGFYVIAIVTTLMVLFSLVVFNYIERIYRRNVYRTLTVTVPLATDISVLLDILKEQSVRVLFCDFKRDYDLEITTAKIGLRFAQRGNIHKVANRIIESLEKSGQAMKTLKWTHR